MSDPWQSDHTITVDGRRWAVRESGDPQGAPLVYFHGTPSSRLEPAFGDDLAARAGVRLICFDRPGYGDSDPAPFSLSSVAATAARLCDELGVGRFATTGQSGGGPFALACAAVLGERVTRVGVTAGAAPFEEVPALMGALDENDRAAHALLPDKEAAARQFAVGFEPFRVGDEATDEDIIGVFRQMSPADAEAFDDPTIARAIAASMRISLRQGCEGAGWDNVSWVGPWDFDVADVHAPVFLYYGGRDPMALAGTGEWLADHLPSAVLDLREEEGHFGAVLRFDQVLADLTRD